jgi:sigma-B regulation protein RsbU (phosphoserine phosphatase)
MRAGGGGVEPLPSRGGPPLGIFSSPGFESGALKLEAGDTLAIYTDGLTEAMSPTRELFDLERVRGAIEESRSLALTSIRERLLARLDAHRAGAALSDDLTLLLLRRQESLRRAETPTNAGATPANDGLLMRSA